MAKYEYDKDYYDTIDEFIHEYTCDNDLDGPCSYGLDFIFNSKEYRISRDQCDTDEKWEIFKKFFNRKVGKYHLAISNEYVDKKDPVFSNGFHTVLGIYDDIYDLIDNGLIDGRNLKSIILDKNTKLIGKD